MKKKRKKAKSADKSFSKDKLVEQINRLSEGLYYVSETDAEITPFVGTEAEAVNKEEILKQIGKQAETPVEEREFAEFFARLTEIQDWFGEEEKKIAEKFGKLKNLLEKNLRNSKVFKVGKIQLDVYFVGLDEKSRLIGIQTKAVET